MSDLPASSPHLADWEAEIPCIRLRYAYNPRAMKKIPAVEVRYRHSRHAAMPHIVKFSGGRSSALVAVALAENGTLDPSRGDLVLFANTSAEHPATYRFADQVSRLLEVEHGLPVLWYEFCTVEDATYYGYRRRPTFRLVKRLPVEEHPQGYRWRGEVFEEMLSFQQMLPNPRQRSCTYKLKLQPSHQLLEEWFSGSGGPAHQGHYRDEPYLSSEFVADEYEKRGGTARRADFMRRAEFMLDQPSARDEQKWNDFTEVPITNPPQPGEGLWGRPPINHLTLLGLRSDEIRRVNRVLDRTFISEGASSQQCGTASQPGGEHPHFPLADSGFTKQEVESFWRNAPFDLLMPAEAGNCTFCFMKGTNQLVRLTKIDDPQRIDGTPSDIVWWETIERKYRREASSRNGTGTTKFGFLGVGAPSYAQVRAGNFRRRSPGATGTPVCDCTD